MTTLAADVEVSRREGAIRSYPVAASTKIYKGSLVNVNSSGYAVAGTDTSGERCVGKAVEQVDNSSGSAGDLWVKVFRGLAKQTATSITQAMVGTLMYVDDSGAVDDIAGVTNAIVAGELVEFVSSTSGWVDLSIQS